MIYLKKIQDYCIMFTVNNVDKYLKIALKEAQKAYDKKEVPVGAVIVKDGKIISRAHNLRETKKNALAHAEILCINKACKKLGTWRLEGCTMYVTLYPCSMCKGAIEQARIDKVYYGAKSEAEVINEEYIFMEDESCSTILKDFFKELRNK